MNVDVDDKCVYILILFQISDCMEYFLFFIDGFILCEVLYNKLVKILYINIKINVFV